MAKDKRKGLGTGLEALFGDTQPEQAPKAAPEAVTELPVMKIEPRSDQPRRHFDEAALQELAESIEKHGVIQPITVRPQESGYYQIIAGERRWRAARRAGLETVPVHILTVDEQKALEMALVENLQREDLNPIEEAQGYEVLQQTYGMTQEAVALSVGKSRPAIANALRLLMLSEPVRKLVESGELSAGHARALLPLEHPDVQLNIAETIIQKHLSVRRAEALVDSLLKQPEARMHIATRAISIIRSATEADTLTCRRSFNQPFPFQWCRSLCLPCRETTGFLRGGRLHRPLLRLRRCFAFRKCSACRPCSRRPCR